MLRKAWLCDCQDFYSGDGSQPVVWNHEPSLTECHRMGDCGWWAIKKEQNETCCQTCGSLPWDDCHCVE